MDTEPTPPTRHDGWTLERQAIFLATLERTGFVRIAAAAAGMNRAGAYRFRERPDGKHFSTGWDLALARRRERLLHERLAKATHELVGLKAGGSARRPHFPRQSDKGDTCRETAKVRQPSQSCRLSNPPRNGEGDRSPRASGGGGAVHLTDFLYPAPHGAPPRCEEDRLNPCS